MREATRDEIMHALTFALQYQGRKRVRQADQLMAEITADRLIEQPEAVRVCPDEEAKGAVARSSGSVPDVIPE